MTPTTARRFANDLASMIELPESVRTAMAAHDAALEVGNEPAVDIALEAMNVAPDKVADLVTRHAQASALAAVLPAARGEVANLLGRRIIRAVVGAGPEILAALKPSFEAAAEQYTTAVAELPADIRPEALIRAGSSVLALHEQAVAACATLDTLRKLRDELADSGARAPGSARAEQRTRVLDLENDAAIDALSWAENSPTLGRWQGWLKSAGVRRIWWPTLEEQAEAIRRIEATIPTRPPKKDPTIHLRGPRTAA